MNERYLVLSSAGIRTGYLNELIILVSLEHISSLEPICYFKSILKLWLMHFLRFYRNGLCAITLNYCTYTNHVGVSPRALYCVVDTSYGLGRSLGHCRPALPKGRKYQMVKTQTQSHVRRPVV